MVYVNRYLSAGERFFFIFWQSVFLQKKSLILEHSQKLIMHFCIYTYQKSVNASRFVVPLKNQIHRSSSQYLFPSLLFWYFTGDMIEWWCNELVTGSTSVSTSKVVWHAEILLMELLGRNENKQFYLCKRFSSHGWCGPQLTRSQWPNTPIFARKWGKMFIWHLTFEIWFLWMLYYMIIYLLIINKSPIIILILL